MTSTMPQSDDLVHASAPAWRVWFALLGAPIAWFIHIFVIWAISEAACPTGLAERTFLGLNVPAALTLAASLIALAVVVASGVVAYRIWRVARTGETRNSEIERTTYLGLVAMLLSGLLLLTVVLETVPFLMFAPCA